MEAERVLGVLGGTAPNCVQVCDLDRLDWSDGHSLLSLYIAPAAPSRRVTTAQYQTSLQQLTQYGMTKWAERTRRSMIASHLPPSARNFVALRAAGRASFERKGVDAEVIKVAEEALRSLLPEPDVNVRCVVTRDTKTPYAFGLRTKKTASVFVAIDTSWRRSVLEESAAIVDGHFVMRLNASVQHRRELRRDRSGQVLSWEGAGDLKWVEAKQAFFARAHARDPWSLRLR